MRAVRDGLSGVQSAAVSEGDRLSVALEFRIFPQSKAYRGMNLPHGTDLDNLVKQTIDALSQTRGGRLPRGLGVIPDDSAVYNIEASKQHVDSDSDSGVFMTILAQ